MKGLKKIALVTAIAAAPFAANADLKALDDSTMGNVTGQAGVTIELETRVSIGEFTYTDTDGHAGSGDDGTAGGTFAVSGIDLGGATVSASESATQYAAATGAGGLLDNLKIDIDVADDGDAVIHVGSLQPKLDPDTGEQVENPDGSPAYMPIDWGMTADSMELRGNAGEQTTLISNMDAWGLLGALDIRVDTDDVNGVAGTGTLNLDVAFTVEQMDFDVEFMGVGIKGMSIRGVNDGGQTLDQAQLTGLLGDPAGEDAALETRLVGLASGALGKSFAIARVDVYKGDNLDGTKQDVLRVDIDDVLMDINIAETHIGGANIGTIGIDNLHVSDTRLAVYGR
ncbi:hypothetical protein B9Q17_03490 [Marinobacter vinifirmus]|uniref:DUF6160 domain-containing protein n=1 Tax=Marinobacter vinifirmus TaxID=355591 RepID=A0A7Z1DWA8_9GAMM|nr:DUF6160 family protein [Marinobacter vinifirmus]OZC37193.1 hypothetical protein B9Q17_03490 [Marinobacter vinifirmus]